MTSEQRPDDHDRTERHGPDGPDSTPTKWFRPLALWGVVFAAITPTILFIKSIGDPHPRIYCDGLNACQPDYGKYMPTSVLGLVVLLTPSALGVCLLVVDSVQHRRRHRHPR